MAEAAAASGSTSPTSVKVKFFCSHGGKILPRPSDGLLKYVGGETRVICVPRGISFSDLMEKITDMFEGDVTLKYQIGSEELDALVSVKSDEDLHHMFDEYDRLERAGTFKLRTFLFPAKPIESHSPHSSGPDSLEQRFLDAVNGVVRTTNNVGNAKPPSHSTRLKSISACPSESTSPRSPSPRETMHNSPINFDNTLFVNNLHGRPNRITKVHSSPSLCSLANHSTQPNNAHHNIPHPRLYLPSYQGHHHHQHQQHLSGYHAFSKLPHEHHVTQPWSATIRDGIGRVPSMSNLAPTGQLNSTHSAPFYKGYPESGGHARWAHLGKPAAVYGDGSTTPGNVSPTHRRIIWE